MVQNRHTCHYDAVVLKSSPVAVPRVAQLLYCVSYIASQRARRERRGRKAKGNLVPDVMRQ